MTERYTCNVAVPGLIPGHGFTFALGGFLRFRALVEKLIHKTDDVTTIDNILLIFPGGHQYLRRSLRM